MRILAFILSVYFFSSCNKYNSADSLLVSADSLMTIRPDSSLQIIRSIPKTDVWGAQQKAYYALLLSEAETKNYIDRNNDSLISVAYHYYRRSNNIDKHARSAYYMGCVQSTIRDYQKAVNSFLETIELARQNNNHYLLGLAYSRLGDLYFEQNTFYKAREYYKKAYESYEDANLTKHALYYCIELGTIFRIENLFDSAFVYFDKAKAIAKQINDTLSLIKIDRNKASIALKQEKYSQAKDLLLGAYKEYACSQIPDNPFDNLLIGTMYSALGNIDSARYCLNRASKCSDLNVKAIATVEFELYSMEKKAGNFELAMKHLNKHYELVDSLYHKEKMAIILDIEKKHNTTKLEYENYKRRTENRYVTIAAILLFVTAVSIFISIHRRHKRVVRERDNQIKEYLIYIKDANDSREELLSMLDSKNEKEQKLKALLEKRFNLLVSYYDLVFTYNLQPDVKKKKIEELVVVESIEQEAMEDIRSIVNEKYNNFVDRLLQTFPSISKKGINFLCLIRLGFTTQQLCAIYNTTNAQTIYSKKNRLAKRFKQESWEIMEAYMKEHIY